MATKKPVDAVEYAKKWIKGMPIDTMGVPVLNDVCEELWTAAPWRWTVGVCEPVTLAAGTVDHALVSPPSDFLYILKAQIWDGQTMLDLTPEPALPATMTVKGVPSKISFVDGVTKYFRLHPVYGSLDAGKTYKLVVWYKKTVPVITKETQYTAGSLIMDDSWFHVYKDGVLWKAYQYADDPRAGTAQAGSNGQVQYTGQLGIFQAGIQSMREREPMLSQFIPAVSEPKKGKG